MITALLSWWDEQPELLTATIHSLKGRVDHLVTLDGPYALFGADGVRSPEDQHQAIKNAAADIGLSFEAHTVRRAWLSEMEKRTFLFRLGYRSNPDWFWMVDADEVVEQWPEDIAAYLARSSRHVGEATMTERHRTSITTFPIRRLFRALPNITVVGAHMNFTAGDGTRLWGRGRLAPAIDLRHAIVVDHRRDSRPVDRHRQATTYYRRRDTLKVEEQMCERCRTEPATTMVATEDNDWLQVCIGCWDTVEWDKQKRQAA